MFVGFYLGEVSDLQDVCLAPSIINPLPLCCNVIVLILH